MNNSETNISGDPLGSPSLLGGRDLLRTLFPAEDSRPSLRWLHRMRERDLIRSKKIGHLRFYDPEEVRRDLDRQFSVRPKNL